jgi:hypothetical protein
LKVQACARLQKHLGVCNDERMQLKQSLRRILKEEALMRQGELEI